MNHENFIHGNVLWVHISIGVAMNHENCCLHVQAESRK